MTLFNIVLHNRNHIGNCKFGCVKDISFFFFFFFFSPFQVVGVLQLLVLALQTVGKTKTFRSFMP